MMYLRITRGHFDPAAYEQVVPVSQEVGIAARRLPGLQHIYQGLDRTAGTLVAVTVWDSEEHARFSRDALGDVMARARAAGVQLDPPEIYEIDEAGAADKHLGDHRVRRQAARRSHNPRGGHKL